MLSKCSVSRTVSALTSTARHGLFKKQVPVLSSSDLLPPHGSLQLDQRRNIQSILFPAKSVVPPSNHYDMVFVGGGVMSLSVAVMLQRIDPNIKMCLLERMSDVAQESSNAWNNAGTGHSAYCELNYTPEDSQGNVNIKKAIDIAEMFAESKQWWSYLLSEGVIDQPVKTFLNKSPHHAFCYGDR